MVLYGENGKLTVPNAFYGAIIEVNVCHLKFFGTWHVLTCSPDCKSVILARNQHMPVAQVPYRVVTPPMAVGELHGLGAEG
jgi:hypothetical protein